MDIWPSYTIRSKSIEKGPQAIYNVTRFPDTVSRSSAVHGIYLRLRKSCMVACTFHFLFFPSDPHHTKKACGMNALDMSDKGYVEAFAHA